MAYRLANGYFECLEFGRYTTTDGVYETYDLRDADEDTIWGFWEDGATKLHEVDMDFSNGFAGGLGERWNQLDVPNAHFHNLKWIEFSSFIPWDNLRRNPNIDGNSGDAYRCKRISDTEFRVDDAGTTCAAP